MIHRYTGQIPGTHQGLVKLGQCPSGVAHDCDISIFIHTKECESWKTSYTATFDILVQKSNKTPAKVDINLWIKTETYCAIEETKSFDNWESSCHFNGLVTGYTTNNLVNIVLKITWTMPNPSNLFFKVPNFLMNETFSDVAIVIGEEKLCAHKVILGSASPVMMAMFTSPMKEAAANQIEIEDVEIDVMKAILTFLYTREDGDFEDTDMALKALVAAEKYDIREVKDLCERKLISHLTTGNALQILDIADTHQSEKLVKESMAFITKHKKEIACVEYFEKICTRKPLLMMEFMKAIV